MELIEELKILENTYHKEPDLLIEKNNSSVLLINISNDLVNNTYLKAITRYIASNTSSSYIINTKESIKLDEEEVNKQVDKLIDEQEIKLIINLIPASKDYDITINTTSNIDYTIIKELEEAFHESLITNTNILKINQISENYDYIEILINDSYHNLENIDKIEKLCTALINYIKMYNNFSD